MSEPNSRCGSDLARLTRGGVRWPIAIAIATACALPGCTASPSPGGAAAPPTIPSTSPAAVLPTTPAPAASRSPTPTTTALVALAKVLQGMVIDPAAGEVPSRGGAGLAPLGKGPLTGRVIVVDPGHNGTYRAATNTRLVPAGNDRTKPCNSSGAATASGYAEHQFNWDVGRRLTGELRLRGAKVILTRPNDKGTGPCVNERAAIGNRSSGDLVISIHADGNLSPTARGFHIILSTTMLGGSRVEASSRRLALILRQKVQAQTGMPRSTYIGRGTALSPRTDIAGLNLSRVPGVMLEAGNLRQPKDAALLAAPSFRAKLAKALADGATEALQ